MDNFDKNIFEYFRNVANQIKGSPLNLGGFSGPDGGGGGPPGGFIGQLPQVRVSYDTSELGLATTSGYPSLLDNLNHIRYRLGIIEASGAEWGGAIDIEWAGGLIASEVTIINFTGNLSVVEDEPGKVTVNVTASGGGGGYTTELPIGFEIEAGSTELRTLIHSTSFQLDSGGNARGTKAVDLQTYRTGIYANYHIAGGDYSSILGGGDNSIDPSCTFSSINGGSSNGIIGNYIFIGGGDGNWIDNWVESGNYSLLVGGQFNYISSQKSCILGGYYNYIDSGYGNTIVGGYNNQTYGSSLTTILCSILGGDGNDIIDSSYSSILGGYNNDLLDGSNYASILGGYENNIIDSSVYSSIIGGRSNIIRDSWIDTQYSLIGGGQSNIVEGSQHSSILGGNLNKIRDSHFCSILGGSDLEISDSYNLNNSDYSSIVGGRYNIIERAKNTFIGGGYNCYINGASDYSVIGGGLSNKTYKKATTIPGGSNASTTRYGEFAHANGSFGGDYFVGQAQHSIFIARNITTNNIATELFLDGSSERIYIEGTTVFDAKVAARRRDVSGESAGYHFMGVVAYSGTDLEFLDTPIKTVLGRNDENWDCNLYADNINNSLNVVVSGVDGKTIRWVAVVDIAQVV